MSTCCGNPRRSPLRALALAAWAVAAATAVALWILTPDAGTDWGDVAVARRVTLAPESVGAAGTAVRVRGRLDGGARIATDDGRTFAIGGDVDLSFVVPPDAPPSFEYRPHGVRGGRLRCDARPRGL